jgi:hypothetical protein
MAQRDIQPLILADMAYSAKKQAIELARHPESPAGTDISPTELLHIQTIEQLARSSHEYAEAVAFGVKCIRLGLNAPSVRRAVNDLFDVALHDEDEAEGMRR